MSLEQAVADSNKNNVDLHVALHSNADKGLAQGPSVYVFRPGTKADKAAQSVYKELMEIYYDKNLGKGVNYNENLKEIRLTRSPAILIEVAFHDNPQDSKWIVDNMEEIASAIVKGIVGYFGRSYSSQDMIKEVQDDTSIRKIRDHILNDSLNICNKEKGSTYTSYLDL